MAWFRRDNPKVWLYSGAFAALVGLSMLVTSIVLKTSVLPAVQRSVWKMRHMDSVHDSGDCEAALVGDMACSGKRFEAWSMPSSKKYDACMAGDAPVSRALAAAIKWCEIGDAGCDKPRVCRQGENYVYHFFSVLNPLEVLSGLKPELQEMEPIRITKIVDKVNPSYSEADGTVQWEEASRFVLTDPADDALLDQVIVSPNAAAMAVLSPLSGSGRVPADAVTYLVAAAMFYSTFEDVLSNMTQSVPFRSIFAGATAVNLDTIVKDQFRAGAFTLALGEILAAPGCPSLVPLLATALNSSIPVSVAVPMMCHSGYRNNIGFSMFSALLKNVKLAVVPSDAPFFYEFEKGCVDHSERPANACYLHKRCPFPAGSAEYSACVQPSLSVEYVDELFETFRAISQAMTDQNSGGMMSMALSFLTGGCRTLNLNSLPDKLCNQLIEQLMRLGRSAGTTNNPKWRRFREELGWGANKLDEDVAAKVYPYFLKGTVRHLMGFGYEKPVKSPAGGQLGPQLWVDSLSANGSTTKFTKGPFVQAMASRFGNQGLNYFTKIKVGSALASESCAFDHGCFNQPAFAGSTCVAEPGVCEPDPVAGHGAGYMPPRFWEPSNQPTETTVFAPDFFLKAHFRLAAADEQWTENLRVNKYRMTGMNVARHNCEGTTTSRGVDCDSPAGTKNIGYQLSYSAPMGEPRTLFTSTYISAPHFANSTGEGQGIYNPGERVKITACKSCPEGRDFSSWLFSEPETGTHVHGSLKLQMNVRLATDAARLSRSNDPTNKKDLRRPAFVMPKDIDVLLPLFWVDKTDTALPFQAAKLASIQSLPKTFNTLFGVLLGLGIVIVACGGYLIHQGMKLKKAKSIIRRSSDSLKLDPLGDRASTNEDCSSAEESRQSCETPQPLKL